MRPFFAILGNDIRLFFKDRVAYVELFGLPILAILIAGFALAGLDDVTVKFGIVGGAKGEVSAKVVEGLEALEAFEVHRFASIEEAQVALKAGDVYSVLQFPEDFDRQVMGGGRSTLVFWSDESRKQINDVVSSVLKGVAQEISGISITTSAAIGVWQQVGTTKSLDELIVLEKRRATELWKDPPVQLEVRPFGQSPLRNNPFNQQVPGYTIMFLLFNCIMHASRSFLDERANKTLLRLYCAPMPRVAVLAGKVSAYFLKGFIQVWILLLVGKIFFGMAWGDSPVALVLLVTALAAAATGLGLVVAVTVRTSAQSNFVSLLLAIGMSALGGSWWPLEIEPELMQRLAYFLTINAWGMDAFATLIWRGGGLSSITTHLLVLTGVFVVGAIIASSRFKLETLAE